MIRLTTPTHTFLFDTDPTEFARILITYAQWKKIVMEKEKEDLTFEAVTEGGVTMYEASFRLTQEKTRAFSANGEVKVQVRVLTEAGEALASEIKTLSVSDVLSTEVLT